MTSLENDLALAQELADRADAIALSRHRAADLRVETKPDRTPVTEADRAVEEAIRDALRDARPGDAVVGEEYGAEEATGTRRWIIDPIDGTRSYLRGMPTWSTLIALEQDGEPVLGLVSMPALGHRWWALRGQGAFASQGAAAAGRPLRVSQVAALPDAQLCWSGIEDWDEVGRPEAILALARRCWRTRGVGDAWQYMLVAEGAADLALDPAASLWDLAAVQVVVEEAGGRFSDLSGRRRADGGSGIASNGLLHAAALELVGLPVDGTSAS